MRSTSGPLPGGDKEGQEEGGETDLAADVTAEEQDKVSAMETTSIVGEEKAGHS